MRVRYRLNEFSVDLSMKDERAAQYFDGFFERDDGHAGRLLASVTVEPSQTGRLRAAGFWDISQQRIAAELETEPVSYGPLDETTAVWSASPDRIYALTGARRLVRDLWLAERLRYSPVAFLHAAAVERDGAMVVFVGDKRAGKTSLLLDAVLRHGWTAVTNDCLVIFRTVRGVHVTGLPTYVSIRGDVADRFDALLRPTINANWADGVSHERWQLARRFDRHASLYVSQSALSTPPLPMLRMSELHTTLVHVGFAEPGSPATLVPYPVNGPDFLSRNLKYQNLSRLPLTPVVDLPSPPGPAEVAQLLAGFADHVEFYRFDHHGTAGTALGPARPRATTREMDPIAGL